MIIYNTLYELLNIYIYGSPEVLTSFQELVLTLVSTYGALFVCAIPFICLYFSVKFICTLTQRW